MKLIISRLACLFLTSAALIAAPTMAALVLKERNREETST